jgi:hypothetical protein
MTRGAWLLPVIVLGCADPAAGPSGPDPAPTAARPASPASPASPAPAPAASPARWTLAVYMAADNDLEDEALFDVEEMLAASHPGLRFVVQLDRSGKSPFSVPTIAPWQGSQRFLIADRTITPAGLLGPVDTGSAPALAGFTTFAARQAGDDHLAIVLWGHGHGALGLADDATTGHRLSPEALGQALRQGLTGAGVPRADLVGFDACSMADLDVASEVAPAARWMFASQHLTPGSGWAYRVLDDFARPHRDSVDDLAELLAQEALTGSAALDAPPAWSLLDLDRAAAPRHALATLAAQLTPGTSLCAALAAPDEPGVEVGMEDMDTLAGQLATAPDLAALGDDLRTTAAACVVRRWGWPGALTGVGLSAPARLPGATPGPGGALAGWWALLEGCRDAP